MNLTSKDIQQIHKTIRVKIPDANFEYKAKSKKFAINTVQQMKNYVMFTQVPATEDGVRQLFSHFRVGM